MVMEVQNWRSFDMNITKQATKSMEKLRLKTPSRPEARLGDCRDSNSTKIPVHGDR